MPETKNLKSIAEIYKSDKIEHQYIKVYESYFEKIRDEKLKILEIGIADGKSLLTWSDYFKNSIIVGIDIHRINIVEKKLNRNNDAVFYFEDALSKNPNCLDVKYNLALSYKNNLEYDSSVELLKKIIHLKPSHLDAHLHLGQIYILTSSFNSGLEEFKKAIKIDTKLQIQHT